MAEEEDECARKQTPTKTRLQLPKLGTRFSFLREMENGSGNWVFWFEAWLDTINPIKTLETINGPKESANIIKSSSNTPS